MFQDCFPSSVSIWKSTDNNKWHLLWKKSEWCFFSCSPHFLLNQMMCASCHMNTVCKQCDRKRPTQTKKVKRANLPQALLLLLPLLLTSPAIFSLDTAGQPVVLGPRPRGWWWMSTPSLLHSHLCSELPWHLDKSLRGMIGWEEQKSRTTHSCKLCRFQRDLQPTAHRWKVDWEEGRGESSRCTHSG